MNKEKRLIAKLNGYKKFNHKYIKTCKKIIKQKNCNSINCKICPFGYTNRIDGYTSCIGGVVNCAKKYLELFE